MANPDHLSLLKRRSEAWNAWRQAEPDTQPDLRKAHLTGADLSGANLAEADLSGANLSGAQLNRANLVEAQLSGAQLIRTNLIDADLSGADLSGAEFFQTDLSGAEFFQTDLSGAEFFQTDLSGSNLSEANLSVANVYEAHLREADLSGATLGKTALSGLNLSWLRGLAEVHHRGPSSIGTETLEHTAGGLTKNPSRRGEVETFLRGAGVSERYMETFGYSIGQAIEFYSCFISYSAEDKPFARRLYDGLQGQGIRCWLDEHQLLPGDDIYEQIDRGIRLWDKVLLCCSEASLASWWVEREIEKALKKERDIRKQQDRRVLALIPLALDRSLFSWESGKASVILERHAADFTGHQADSAKFAEQFERVVKALRTDEAKRERPPEPKL